jgi:transcriptional antiterminator NusG
MALMTDITHESGEPNTDADLEVESGAAPSAPKRRKGAKAEPAEPKPAEPKDLKRGVDARRAVERPHEVQGVSTQVIAESSRKGKAGEKSRLEQTETFDPATDLPMFREGMNWFVLRVASNKERSVRLTLLRKVQIEGLDSFVGRIMVPTEKTKTLKAGKQRVTETMLYPGYVFVEMRLEPDGRIPQDIFFLIKETDGVGDFVGTAGRPTPMAQHEVEKMLFDSRKPEEMPQVKMEFAKGDKVTIKEGPFQNYEGEVDEVLPDKGLVRVLVTIFGRQAPIELEYWQISKGVEER